MEGGYAARRWRNAWLPIVIQTVKLSSRDEKHLRRKAGIPHEERQSRVLRPSLSSRMSFNWLIPILQTNRLKSVPLADSIGIRCISVGTVPLKQFLTNEETVE
jgi:hypothetical protein